MNRKKLFFPDFFYKAFYEISPRFLKENGFKTVFLDVDNTLTEHNCPDPLEQTAKWLEDLKEEGLTAVLFSNNSEQRVSVFAEVLGLPYIHRANKPLRRKVVRFLRNKNIARGEACLIGDQVFTDVLCGSLTGIKSFLVDPVSVESKSLFFKIKRGLEKFALRKYEKE